MDRQLPLTTSFSRVPGKMGKVFMVFPLPSCKTEGSQSSTEPHPLQAITSSVTVDTTTNNDGQRLLIPCKATNLCMVNMHFSRKLHHWQQFEFCKLINHPPIPEDHTLISHSTINMYGPITPVSPAQVKAGLAIFKNVNPPVYAPLQQIC